MTERCLTLGCPEAVRLSLQDPCTGLPICGVDSGYVLSCIRNWSIEPIVREGEANEFTADCGNMVIRDRQDDQLLGYTISFETSTRSVELESLVTGKVLIPSGINNIGTYGVGSNLGCTEPSNDPRLLIEAFYKLSKCVSGADHVRVVLPLGQFKVTELDREGTITFYRYTAETGIVLANALGTGPFNDFPADVSAFIAARTADEYTTGLDFEESITIAGQCGFLEVVCPDTNGDILIFNAQNNGEIWSVDSDVTNPTLLSAASGSYYPLFSRNSDRSDYVIGGNDGSSQWFLYDSTGALVANFAAAANGGVQPFIGALRPGTNEVVYETFPVGPEIERATVGGVTNTVLTGEANISDYYAISWSPDGTMIAFIDNDTSGDWHVRVVDENGTPISSSVNIGDPATTFNTYLLWSPDSTTLYTIANNGQVSPDSELIAIDAATGAISTIAVVPGTAGTVPTSIDLTPDGNTLVLARYDSIDNTLFAIFTADIASAPAAPLVQRSTYLTTNGTPSVSVSPDSQYAVTLYDVNSANGPHTIGTFDLTAGAPAGPVSTGTLPDDDNVILSQVVWRAQP